MPDNPARRDTFAMGLQVGAPQSWISYYVRAKFGGSVTLDAAFERLTPGDYAEIEATWRYAVADAMVYVSKWEYPKMFWGNAHDL